MLQGCALDALPWNHAQRKVELVALREELGRAKASKEEDLQSFLEHLMSALNIGVLRAAPPPEYLCPISERIMQHPVTVVETGVSYERAVIERWFDKGDDTFFDPLTGNNLSTREITENGELKSRIQSWWHRRWNLTLDQADSSPSEEASVFASPPDSSQELKSSRPSKSGTLLDAAKQGDLATVLEELRSGDPKELAILDSEKQWSPLQWASAKGHTAIVQALIQAGADLNTGWRLVRNFILKNRLIAYQPHLFFEVMSRDWFPRGSSQSMCDDCSKQNG
ncbi:hypothetical protein CYMTET_47818 [Cymbomonas tetramitiformis]|uniref:U-box domain-containing protein n=1 Tax=Cymbomonas tetramitiformis TaxID=36881 RepID=A0AAE0BV01_9CHLO|nr:hypothetical protein CYMTET_47818 [Cymbomonas tetramitiformis]